MNSTYDLHTQLRCGGKPARAGRESGVLQSTFRELKHMRSRSDRFARALISARLLPLTGAFRSHRRSFLREQFGSSVLETAIVLPVLLLMLVGAVDYGRGFYVAIEVASAAESAAMYGTSYPADTAGIRSMAQMDAKEVPSLAVSSSYGCECADGTGAVVSCVTSLVCSTNAVRYVDVSTSAVYVPLLPYPAIPSSFTLKGHSRMRMSPN